MKLRKTFGNVLMAVFFGLAAALTFTPAFGLGVGIAAMAGGQLINAPLGSLSMAVQQELWVDYIIENLFKDDAFLAHCYDESDSVLAGSVVHIPQAGAKPNVVKNRTNLPAVVVQRTDTDVTYPLDVYTTDPILLKNAELNEISYDKMSNVLSEHLLALRESIGDSLLDIWAPSSAAAIIRTTGGAVLSHMPSATGNRKLFVKENLKAARKLMNKMNIPREGRCALMDEDMYEQLTLDSTLLQRDGVNGGEMSLKEGTLLKLYGFHILTRSTVLNYDNAGTPVHKPYTAAGAATDNAAVICWQKNQLAKAMGSVTFFEALKDPQFYGDIYSAEIKMGGRIRRANEAGVVVIVQDAA